MTWIKCPVKNLFSRFLPGLIDSNRLVMCVKISDILPDILSRHSVGIKQQNDEQTVYMCRLIYAFVDFHTYTTGFLIMRHIFISR